MFDKLSRIQSADLKGKIVLLRVDHNVVKKGTIKDTYRIDQSLGTVFNIYARGGKVIFMSHVGRPKDKKSGEITVSPETSVNAIVKYLESKLNIKIAVPEIEPEGKKGLTSIGTLADDVKKLKNGEFEAIYLPNTRWFAGEEAKNEDADKMAEMLASVADLFVNDAFGSWQPHTSTAKIAEKLPSYAGFLMQKEIEHLDSIFKPAKPFTAVVAGSKFDTKIKSLGALLETADHLVLGGVIYNAYLCAKYGLHIKGITEEDINDAKEFVALTEKYSNKIVELPFVVESNSLESKELGKAKIVDIRKLKSGDSLEFVLDAAAESFGDEKVKEVFMNSGTIFVNAVMGLTPQFSDGTIAMNELIGLNKKAVKLFGGGDTLQEMKLLTPKLYLKAVSDSSYYMFTGGGAVLKAIESKDAFGMKPVQVLLKK